MQFGLNCKKACWRLRPKPRLPEQSSVVNKGDTFLFPDHDKKERQHVHRVSANQTFFIQAIDSYAAS